MATPQDAYLPPAADDAAQAVPQTDEERREALLARERRVRGLGWAALALGLTHAGLCGGGAASSEPSALLSVLFFAAGLLAAGGGLALLLLRGIGRWLLAASTALLGLVLVATGATWTVTRYFAPLVVGWLALVAVACAPDVRPLFTAEHRALVRRTPAPRPGFGPVVLGLALAIGLLLGNLGYQFFVVTRTPGPAEGADTAVADEPAPP